MTINAIKLCSGILGISLCLSVPCFGQAVFNAKKVAIEDSVKHYLNLKDSANYIDPDLFDQKLDSVLNKVSGVTYKDGKGIRTSATIDDKGLNLNFVLYDGYYNTFQLAVSGKAEEKFIDIVSNGKYGNTLSGGMTWNWFPRLNTAKFMSDAKKTLYDKIERTDNYYSLKVQKEVGLSELKAMIQLFSSHGKYLKDETSIDPKDIVKYDDSLSRLKTLLKTYKSFLSKDFDELSFAQQKNQIDAIEKEQKDVFSSFVLKQDLDSIKSLQLNAPFSSFTYIWTTASLKFNSTSYPIFNDTAKTKDYTRKFYDNFFTLDLSVNILKKWKNLNMYVLPTAKLAHKRKFDEDKLISMNVPRDPVTIGGMENATFKQTSFYKDVVDQKFTMAAELPVVFFLSKSNVGLEVAATHEVVPWKNFGGRVGIYIPFNLGDDQIIIEPMVKFENLERSDLNFKKDKVSFGVSLTATVPNFLNMKKK